MDNELSPGFAAVGQALPSAVVMWKLGARLMSQAGPNPAAQRWARIGAVAAGVVGIAAILVGISNSMAQRPTPSAEDSTRPRNDHPRGMAGVSPS